MSTAILDSPITRTETSDAPGCECTAPAHPFNQCPDTATWIIGIKHNGETPCPVPLIKQVCKPCLDDFVKAAEEISSGGNYACGGCGARLRHVSDLVGSIHPLGGA